LPLKRIELSEREISELIPTLSGRQFVVTKDKLSEAELQLQRELFWYREALFKSVRGHWKEVRGSLALPPLPCKVQNGDSTGLGWRDTSRRNITTTTTPNIADVGSSAF